MEFNQWWSHSCHVCTQYWLILIAHMKSYNQWAMHSILLKHWYGYKKAQELETISRARKQGSFHKFAFEVNGRQDVGS